jgi:hypothetical protein
LTSNAHRIAELKAGWDGPGSICLSAKALFLATTYTRNALQGLSDVTSPQLVPGGDGSIQVEWHAKHGELELDIDAHGRPTIWIRDHRNGAEFDAEDDAAIALFYRWAPWVASELRDDLNASVQTQVPTFSIAA